MKLIVTLTIFSLSDLVVSANDSTGEKGQANTTCESNSKTVCYKLDELTQFCPPCPPACAGLNNCPCTFSDGTVIQPKVLTYSARPPYCSACLNIHCLVVATEVIIHSEFERESFSNDIAIIKLSTGATFKHYVRPVCLWNSSNDDFADIVGKSGTIVGWGQTETGNMGSTSNFLKEGTAPVVSVLDCLESNPHFFWQVLAANKFCAGYRNGTGVCLGDAGGSMTFKKNGIYYIRGITSIAPRRIDQDACDPRQYAFFTDVANYLHWIKDKSSS